MAVLIRFQAGDSIRFVCDSVLGAGQHGRKGCKGETKMPVEIRAWKFAVPLVGTLFLAAACSSSNSGGGSSNDDPECNSRCETRNSLDTFFATPSAGDSEDAAEENIVRQTLDAANAVPDGSQATDTEGGVFQAAGVNSDASTTLPTDAPEVEIAVVRGNAGSDDDRTTFLVTVGSLNVTTVSAAADGTGLTQSPVELEDEARGPGNDEVVEFVALRGPADARTGSLNVWLRANKPGRSVGGDTDYLAYGFWVVSADGSGTTTTDGVDQIGAFVDSSDGTVYPMGSLDALAGDAVYIGQAEGLYHEEVGGVSDFMSFTAETRLTASFGDGTLIGAGVSGTINNFEGLPEEFDGLAVALAAAVPDDSIDGGLFTGDTSATLTTLTTDASATPFTGDWGGKFYDDENRPAAENYPDVVAGTFGLQSMIDDPTDDATRMDRRALLGIFWGDFHPNPPVLATPVVP